MKRISGIYKIVNRVNGKYYLGSSDSIYRRWNNHRKDLRAGCHYNTHLQRAWNKHGHDNFDFVIIKNCDKDVLLQEEQKYLDECKLEPQTVYNQTFLAGGGSTVCGRHIITKDGVMKFVKPEDLQYYFEIGWIKKGLPLSEEAKEKISKSNKGKKKPPFSIEHRKKLGDVNRGKTYIMSESHRKNLRISHLGKRASPETKQKMSQMRQGENHPFYGKHHSDATKQKLSIALKGKFLGKNNPRFDDTIYMFRNIIDNRIENLTQYEFCKKFGTDKSNLNKLLKGKIKSCQGWTMVHTQSFPEVVQ